MKAGIPAVDEVFEQAIRHTPGPDRSAFLDEACGTDADLRQRVDRLLKAFAEAGSFLESPAVPDGPTVELPPPILTGTQIGPYKLLQQIGEGGMGVVYMAEQTQPVHRKVALKIIKPGLDSRQVIARFEAERQALAMMDHVNIARVIDGGTVGVPALAGSSGSEPPDRLKPEHQQGRPYFVMELIHGVPITKYCDDQHLTPRERLELFIPVCQAIQHAHQKGIIHRDIKPSNVLVTLYDGKPVPKVIDFGVAKAIDQKLTDNTLFTNFGTMVGTLEYMSPEQAEMNNLGVDTRSDLYSLGVLLYELLTGSTPLTRKRLKEAADLEILRMIKEEEPQKPSTRLSESGDKLASISAQRKMEPAKLTKFVRGELDWIVMKTLEKNRNLRYETAIGLAVDVQRYLAGEPVQACPPSAGYRLRKFVRRNKGAVIAAAIIFMSLVGGIVGTSWGLVQSAQATDAERQAKEVAQNRLTQIEKGNVILGSIFKNLDPGSEKKEGKSLRVLLGERLEAAVKQLEGEAIGDPVAVAHLQLTLGESLLSLGYTEKAIDLVTKARVTFATQLGSDHPDTLNSMLALANGYAALGRHAEALKLDEETLVIRKSKLGPDHPDTLVSMNNLAVSYYDLGRHAEAMKLNEETIAIKKTKLGPDHPDTLASMNNLANCYSALGRNADSLKLREETLALKETKLGLDHPDTLHSMNNLANSYYRVGRYSDALKLGEQALALRKTKLGPDHPDTLHSMNNLAFSYNALLRYSDALKLYDEALSLRKAKIGTNHPDTLESINNLASLLSNCPDPKIHNPSRAVELAKSAVALSSNDGDRWNTLGVALYRVGDWKAAINALEKSMQLRQGGDSNDWFFLAMAHWQMGQRKEARKWYDQAVQWMEKNKQSKPQDEELSRFKTEAGELLKVKDGDTNAK